MSQTMIRDMLFVKNLERRLGRNLTEDELDQEDELELRFPDGHREFVVIPRLVFPYDLLSAPELGAIVAYEENNQDETAVQYSNAS